MKNRCLKCMELFEQDYQICPYCGYKIGEKPKEVYHLHPGMILQERYIIGVVIGFGGFGTTYKAWDMKLDNIVAIKEYYPTGLVNRVPGTKKVITYTGRNLKEFHNGLMRFLDEAKNEAKFNEHPNIVNVYNYFEENNTAYIVMEYLEGISLKEYVKLQGGKIDVETTVTVLLSVISALKAVHKEGIVHRDISLDNIFICANNKVKLIDFGAARFSAGEEEKMMSIVLKPGFAPPEQYRVKSKQGPWTDIYALGATMYRAITGVMPVESVNRVVEDTMNSPKEIIPELPTYIDVTLMKAMALAEELRFQNVKDFESAILNKCEVVSIKKDLKKRKRKRRIGIIAAAIVVVMFGFYGIHTYTQKQNQAKLLPAKILVWVPIQLEETREEEMQCYMNMGKEFEQIYPQIKVDYVGVLRELYDEELLGVLGTEDMPDLFESDLASNEILIHSENLMSMYRYIELDNYYLLNHYKKYFPDKNQMPLGFSIPIIYSNIALMNSQEIDVNNSFKQYLQKNTVMVVTGSDNYTLIQNSLPCEYALLPYKSKDVNITFTSIWSVCADAEEAEILAAERLLYFYIGEKAQVFLHINKKEAFPLNKNVLSIYSDIYPEMEFILNYMENKNPMVLGKDKKSYDSIYKEILLDEGKVLNDIIEYNELD